MENEKILCPLKKQDCNTIDSVELVSHGVVRINTSINACDERGCAWWDEDAQACSVLVIAKASKKVAKNGK